MNHEIAAAICGPEKSLPPTKIWLTNLKRRHPELDSGYLKAFDSGLRDTTRFVLEVLMNSHAGMVRRSFGTLIRVARAKKEISQAELARRLGVPQTTVSGWESDRQIPEINKDERLAKLSAELGIPVDELLEASDRHWPKVRQLLTLSEAEWLQTQRDALSAWKKMEIWIFRPEVLPLTWSAEFLESWRDMLSRESSIFLVWTGEPEAQKMYQRLQPMFCQVEDEKNVNGKRPLRHVFLSSETVPVPEARKKFFQRVRSFAPSWGMLTLCRSLALAHEPLLALTLSGAFFSSEAQEKSRYLLMPSDRAYDAYEIAGELVKLFPVL